MIPTCHCRVCCGSQKQYAQVYLPALRFGYRKLRWQWCCQPAEWLQSFALSRLTQLNLPEGTGLGPPSTTLVVQDTQLSERDVMHLYGTL
jgi:hypothetical protein